jgi:predicted DNA-binding mobile mystery protein A
MDTRIARKSLDQKIGLLPELQKMERPHKGWIRAIRQALGMTSKQYAMRLGVSPPRITALEKSEVDETITLASLRRAADALDCALVYSFVPKTTLEDNVKSRSRLMAAKILGYIDHTMSLEAQNLNKEELVNEVEELAEELRAKKIKIIWNEQS